MTEDKIDLVLMNVMFFYCVVLELIPETPSAQPVQWIFLCSFASMVLDVVMPAPRDHMLLLTAWAAGVAQEVIDAFAWVLYLIAIQSRMELAESSFGQSLGARRISRLRQAVLVLSSSRIVVDLIILGLLISKTAYPAWFAPAYVGFIKVRGISISFLFAIAGLITFVGFSLLIKAACPPPTVSEGSYLHAEAAWARRTTTRVRNAMLASAMCWSTLGTLVTLSAWAGKLPSDMDISRVKQAGISDAGKAGLCLMSTIELFCFMIMAGCFLPRQPGIRFKERKKQKNQIWRQNSTNRTRVWQDKVEELADRSMSVQALLDFHRQLSPEVMPHYDPLQHKTNDVVRQAIIPTSRTQLEGTAFAAPGMPNRMVTHTWGGPFLHLVAAVAADCRNLNEYAPASKQLLDDAPELEQSLRAEGCLQLRYWICAFCVNQHASICAGFGPAPALGTPEYRRWDACRRDSVTGMVHPICDCATRKHFNDSPDQCELNKFDDVMALLHEQVPNFQQLVAVDSDLDVFARIWCVAEMYQAYYMGIPQRLCLTSNAAVDICGEDYTIFRQFTKFSITECSASRPEDKEEILHKIQHIDEFDFQLQAAIFSTRGLLSEHLVGFRALDAAAFSTRRLQAVWKENDSAEESC
eukprot:TRINITY_DN89637_c0_g1_i1.p1 TRINITY_DN89637_c0_g1~~TRINITY_DN89637_c0_g1_i1.p1  ORF type:complete len:638 (-),score=88.33 TRINITY_DN89637_c0_g1_i1:182-2095(-)